MKRAKKARAVWLTVGILTSVLAVLSIPVIVLSALNRLYFLMAVAIAFVAHGVYGVTFYFLAFARAGDRLRCLRAVTEYGLRSYDSVGASAQLSPSAARDTLARCLKRGYLFGFYLGGTALEPIVSEAEEKPTALVCEYCGSSYLAAECPSCGAKHTD